MKSTTVRFADPVYGELERASRLTGLPINSIVTVACLDWLRDNLTFQRTAAPMRTPRASWPQLTSQLTLGAVQRQSVRLTPSPLAGSDPLWVFTAPAQDALGRAQEAAVGARQPWIGTNHLLLGLAEVPEGRAAQALDRLRADVAGIAAAIEPEQGGERSGPLLPTSQLRRAMRRAHEEANGEDATQVGTDHLLLGLLRDGESLVAEALEEAGVTYQSVRDALAEVPPEA